MRTGLGEVRLTRPVAYQEVEGQRQAVRVVYAVAGNTYGFRVVGYDTQRPLVIDPFLHATYLGGSQHDYATALALNATTGEVYVGGVTSSTDFPGTSGGAQSRFGGGDDAFVVRLNADLAGVPCTPIDLGPALPVSAAIRRRTAAFPCWRSERGCADPDYRIRESRTAAATGQAAAGNGGLSSCNTAWQVIYAKSGHVSETHFPIQGEPGLSGLQDRPVHTSGGDGILEGIT